MTELNMHKAWALISSTANNMKKREKEAEEEMMMMEMTVMLNRLLSLGLAHSLKTVCSP